MSGFDLALEPADPARRSNSGTMLAGLVIKDKSTTYVHFVGLLLSRQCGCPHQQLICIEFDMPDLAVIVLAVMALLGLDWASVPLQSRAVVEAFPGWFRLLMHRPRSLLPMHYASLPRSV